MFLFCSPPGETWPRRKRYDKIHVHHLQQIERQVSLLRIALSQATLTLTPFRPHYDAISKLHDDLRCALNVLNDRPADNREPHVAPMQGERKGRTDCQA